MLHLLRRHPVPILARFDYVLVLTYAFPAPLLRPLATRGLRLDEWNDLGFVAAAFVQTRALRPSIVPSFLGQSFFLCGYRVFCRYTTPVGRELRGLRILRSDADKRRMVMAGNLLTHYNYHHARIKTERTDALLKLEVVTPDGGGDVRLTAETGSAPAALPAGSPFADEREARRFAGPMPFTFNYEPETDSVIRIEGVREAWRPRLASVDVQQLSFLESGSFGGVDGRLASCFIVENVNYRWNRGVREPVGAVDKRSDVPQLSTFPSVSTST